MIHALSAEGRARLDAVLAARPLLAFDIDGTLAPIVARPEDARLPDAVQRGLHALGRVHDVAIITGRAVEDARRMLSFEPRYLIGNHGAEGLPGWQAHSQAYADTVKLWRNALAVCEPLRASGVALEDKAYSISLHFRRAVDPAAAQDSIGRCVAGLWPAPRVIAGKAVVNLLPPDAPDKGAALRALIAATRCGAVLYVGDDDTDEAVFALRLPGVLSVRVEPSAASVAALFLRDQQEVLALIEDVAERSPRRIAPSRESRSS